MKHDNYRGLLLDIIPKARQQY